MSFADGLSTMPLKMISTKRGEAGDRGQLAAGPGEVGPGPGSSSGSAGRRAQQEQPAQDRERPPGAAAVVATPQTQSPDSSRVTSVASEYQGRKKQLRRITPQMHPHQLRAIEPRKSIAASLLRSRGRRRRRDLFQVGSRGRPLGIDAAAADDLARRQRGPGPPRRGRRLHGHLVGETNGPGRLHAARGASPLPLDREVRLGTGVVGVLQRGPRAAGPEAAALADASAGASRSGSAPRRTGSSRAGTGCPFESPLTEVSETIDFLRTALAGERAPNEAGKLETAPAAEIPIIARRPARQDAAAGRREGRRAIDATSCPSRACRRSSTRSNAGAPEGFELLCRFFCLPGEREQVGADRPVHVLLLHHGAGLRGFYRWLGHGEAIDPMVAAWAPKDRQVAGRAGRPGS